jgi:hypothetical protein
VADHARRPAHSMGHGGVLLHSHTQVRPTFPFVQFNPLGVGERMAQAVGLARAANTCIVQGDKLWEAQTSRNRTAL